MTNLAVKFTLSDLVKKEERLLREYLAKLGRKGGKARAEKYDRETLSKWAKLGGRPPKKKRS